MRKRYRLATAALALLSSTASHADVTLLDKDDWKVLFGGFVEVDLFTDSTRSFTEVAGSKPVARSGAAAANGRTQFSMRNSRFDFSVLPPSSEGWKTKGYLEFDLLGFDPEPGAPIQNGESSFATNPTVRVRHAFFSATHEDFQILVGQTWSLLGWQPQYVLTTASIQPATGSVYERTPQLMVSHTTHLSEESATTEALAITRPVQRDSRLPGLDGGLKLNLGSRKSGFSGPNSDIRSLPMSFAVSGALREFVAPNVSGGTGDQTHRLGSAIALDTMIPILSSSDGKSVANTLTLTGEFTTGRGYGEEFPNWTGNLRTTPDTALGSSPATYLPNLDAGQGGFDAPGSFQLVKLRTWNTQLQYHLPEGFNSFVTLGYGQLKSTNIDTLTTSPASGSLYAKSEIYFANFFHDFGKQIRMAVEFDHFATTYVDGFKPSDNRAQVSGWFRF